MGKNRASSCGSGDGVVSRRSRPAALHANDVRIVAKDQEIAALRRKSAVLDRLDSQRTQQI